MANDNGQLPEGLAELLGSLMGKCEHELQLMRVTTVLGVLAAKAGGRLEADLDDARLLDGKGIGIRFEAGRVVVELVDAPQAGEASTPTHSAPSTWQ